VWIGLEGSQIVACAGRTHLFDSASHQSTDRDEAQTLLDPGSKDVRQSLNTPPWVRDAVVKDYDGARDEILFNPASNVTHGWVCRVVSIRGAVYPCVSATRSSLGQATPRGGRKSFGLVSIPIALSLFSR